MSRIISFRGQMASDSVREISIQTNNGMTGYKIVKLQCITNQPSAYDVEGLLKIYKTDQGGTVTADINFADNRLLAVSYNTFGNQPYEVNNVTSIFDNEIFNQDIYLTYVDNGGNTRPMNFYLELKQMPLDLSEQTVATLKDIRNVGAE